VIHSCGKFHWKIEKMKSAVTILVLLYASTGVLGQARLNENPCMVLPPPGHGFVNDYSSCASYFSCVSYLPFEVTCPHPLYFDPNRLVCDSPQNVACSICRASGIHGVRDPTSCTRWTLCVNGVQIAQECAPGTAFDASIERCNLAEFVNCAADTCAQLEGGVGIAPAPDSCTAYQYCYGGRSLARGQCQTGMTFDTTTNRCVRSGEGTCFPGTTFRRASVPIVPVALISTEN